MITLEDIKPIHEDVESYFKIIHSNPELGLLEYETSDFIATKLEEFGVEVIRNVAKTGVIGIIKGEEDGKTLMLRADIDALPIEEKSGVAYASKNKGVMHACGHDAHTAMLLGAAKYLSENRHLIKGKVKFLFQPAEEGEAPGTEPLGPAPGGAYYVVEEGHLKDVDACLAIHVTPLIKTGELMIHQKEAMASTDMFTVIITGKGSHGSAPESGIDPIPAVIEIMAAFNMLPARELCPLDPCVVTIGTINTISSSWNVIPEKVELTGTFRTFDPEIRETVNRRLKEISEKIADAHRCKGEYIRDIGYFPTTNDEKMVEFVVNSAKMCLGDENVILSKKPFTSGEDVGEYFKVVPGAIMWLGCANADDKCPAFLHNPKFILDIETLDIGVMLHVNNVIEFLNKK